MVSQVMRLGERFARIALGFTSISLAEPAWSAGGLVVSEVMANVKGPEGSFGHCNEYVELLNVSANPIDLAAWSISDGDAVDLIVPWNDSLGLLGRDLVFDTYVVPAGVYCLILDRDYARAPDSVGHMPYDVGVGTVILTTTNSTIGNGLSTSDPIILLDEKSDTVDTYGTPHDGFDDIPFDPGDGRSAERVFPTEGDEDGNWLACASQSGSSPGTQNSVTPYLGLGLSWEDIELSPYTPEPGTYLDIEATVHNRSLDLVRDVEVIFYWDSDGDGSPGGDEIIEVATVEDMPPLGGEAKVRARWPSVPAGCHRVGVEVRDTVRAFRAVRSGRGPGFVVVNEIMYDPETSGEWVEIYNWSPHELNLRGWTLRDEGKCCTVSERDVMFESGEFAVVCGDSSVFAATYPLCKGKVLEAQGFPSLSNSGDSIVLSDLSGYTMDCIYYVPEWGGGDGVSLERVCPTHQSGERANWSSCVAAEGATPGQENSIYADAKPTNATLGITPNPFSPDGDGYEDCTAISYALPFAVARLRIIVYDRKGRIVRQILSGDQSASAGALLWDGRDDSGRLLPVGVYLIYLEACDLVTQARVSSKSTAVLARRLD